MGEDKLPVWKRVVLSVIPFLAALPVSALIIYCIRRFVL